MAAPTPAPAPVLKTTLRSRDGAALVVTLCGKVVALGEGSERRGQTLPSEAAAREHYERILMLRRKAGYSVVRTETVAEESVRPPGGIELEDFDGKIERDGDKWTLTFMGDADEPISQKLAGALVARIGTDAPRRVQLVCDFAAPKRAWERALQGVQLPSVAAFIFDTPFQTQTRQDENSIGDLAAVLRACPNLRDFFATGALSLSPVAHASLRALHLLGNPLTRTLAQGLGGCAFPGLGRLVLSLTADGEAAREASFVAALRTLQAPRLRALHLEGVDDAADTLARLLGQGLPPALKELSLRGPCDLDALRPVLTQHADALRTLETLGIDTEDDLSEEEQARWPLVRDADAFHELTLPAVYEGW